MSHAPQVERQPIDVFAAAALVVAVVILATRITAGIVAANATSAVVVGVARDVAPAVVLGGVGGIPDDIAAAAAFPPPRDAHRLQVLSSNRSLQRGSNAPKIRKKSSKVVDVEVAVIS